MSVDQASYPDPGSRGACGAP